MKTIEKIWFIDERIYLKTTDGEVLSRPLEAFPRLKEANEIERNAYKIGKFGDDIRWELIDEDIHLDSFYAKEEPHNRNEIAVIFNQFPQLNVSEVARSIGINKSLLAKYIYGIKTPSKERTETIKDALHQLGNKLIAI